MKTCEFNGFEFSLVRCEAADGAFSYEYHIKALEKGARLAEWFLEIPAAPEDFYKRVFVLDCCKQTKNGLKVPVMCHKVYSESSPYGINGIVIKEAVGVKGKTFYLTLKGANVSSGARVGIKRGGQYSVSPPCVLYAPGHV